MSFLSITLNTRRRTQTLFNFSYTFGFPAGSDSKESACDAGDPGSISGLNGIPAEGNRYPLQYSFLENPMDRGVWWPTVHRVTQSCTRLSE